MEELYRYYKEFLYTLHSASSNINILHNHGKMIKTVIRIGAINKSKDFFSDFTSFPTSVFFFCSRIQSRIPHCIYLSCLLSLFHSWQFLSLCLSLLWQFWRILVRVFVNVSNLGLSDGFSLDLGNLGKNTTKVMLYSCWCSILGGTWRYALFPVMLTLVTW